MNRKKIALALYLAAATLGSGSFPQVMQQQVLAESSVLVRTYSGVPKHLSRESDPFDLTVEFIDTAHKAYDSITPQTATASFDSAEFALENPSSLPEIEQIKKTDVRGSLRFRVTFKNVVYLGEEKQSINDQGEPISTSNKYGSISIGVSYRVDGKMNFGEAKLDIKKPKDELQESKKPKSTTTPRFRLIKYSYGNSNKVKAESTFDFGFSLANTSWNYSVENIKTEVICDGGVIAPVNGSLTTFVDDSLEPQGVLSKKLKFSVSPNATAGVQTVKILVKGEYFENNERKELSDEINIQIPVEAKDEEALAVSLRAQVSAREISEGDEISLKIVAKNETITKDESQAPVAYNPTIKIEGVDGFEFEAADLIFDLKNLYAGNPLEKTLTLMPKYKRAAKPEAKSEPDAAQEKGQGGEQEAPAVEEEKPQVFRGKVELTYTDAKHKDFLVTREFSFKLNPKPSEDDMGGGMVEESTVEEMPEIMPEEATEKRSWKFWAICGAAGFAALMLVVFIVRKVRAKRSLDDDEDI